LRQLVTVRLAISETVYTDLIAYKAICISIFKIVVCLIYCYRHRVIWGPETPKV